MRVHFVVHEAFEAPGAYEDWVLDRGHAASYSRVHAGDRLPQSTDAIDLLVVMGGPQSPSTTVEECPHFDAAAECRLIAQCINDGKAVIGVCLGSQLIGEALSAPYAHSPEKEIGNFPISLTPEGRANAKFSGFGSGLEVGHWHSDMPGLTASATVIARSEGCPRQIVEYGDLVYGFQCHMELTPEVVELLIAASAAELSTLTGYRFVQQPEALRANVHDAMNATLFGFLDRLAEAYIVACSHRASPRTEARPMTTRRSIDGQILPDLHRPVAVFDCGIGSYAAVAALRALLPSQDILYFADRASFPYGRRGRQELLKILGRTLGYLDTFAPAAILVASNAPSIIVLDELKDSIATPVFGVRPPIHAALAQAGEGDVAILGVRSLIESPELRAYAAAEAGARAAQVHPIDATALVELVESGAFLFEPERTQATVDALLDDLDARCPSIGAMTLSSTHIPWLRAFIERARPNCALFDPLDEAVVAIAPSQWRARAGRSAC
ncbi:hypothetical protein R1A27_17415 [Methylobacterium sp. NMS12]|uniref:glutamine amidotransferase-related protein n=1 Tax=Methylobacterium sp. NMS12 TaxID=3079766 RepID=UPI003F880E60